MRMKERSNAETPRNYTYLTVHSSVYVLVGLHTEPPVYPLKSLLRRLPKLRLLWIGAHAKPPLLREPLNQDYRLPARGPFEGALLQAKVDDLAVGRLCLVVHRSMAGVQGLKVLLGIRGVGDPRRLPLEDEVVDHAEREHVGLDRVARHGHVPVTRLVQEAEDLGCHVPRRAHVRGLLQVLLVAPRPHHHVVALDAAHPSFLARVKVGLEQPGHPEIAQFAALEGRREHEV
mmetsp:Transcript_17651/g.40507  ORF Transcript_17651/g.40507 Transcript_17651/m.40507 type:complete len:231 (+) Transcript_17651:178-870(+)